MALGALGTFVDHALVNLDAWSAVLSPADVAAIAAAITDDSKIAAILSGYGAGATGFIGTGSTHTNTTIDSVARVSGAALASVRPNDLVLGSGIAPGTFVTAFSGTTITLNQAATDTAGGVYIAVVRPNRPGLLKGGNLVIPNRGVLKVLPGDYVGIDNTGWPILLSGATINYIGTQWTRS